MRLVNCHSTSSPHCKSHSQGPTRNRSPPLPNPDAGWDIAWQTAKCSRQSDREVARDFGDGSADRIDRYDALGADLGHDQLAIGRQCDAFRSLQILGDHGLASTFETWPA